MASTAMGTTLRQIHRLFDEGSVAFLSDERLLERFAADRDESAFEALVARHGPMVLGVCRSVVKDEHDAEDAFQATFLTLARKAGSLRADPTIGGWLYRVARRVALQASLAVAGRKARESEASEGAKARIKADPAVDEVLPLLHEEIDRLPDRQRLPVVLCYLEELTYEQAARELRWTVPTVRCRLARARERLRTRLALRGVTGATAVLTALLAPRSATAAVPHSWARSAVSAACGSKARASAIVLAEGVVWTVAVTRVKVALAVAAVAVAAATAAALLGVAGPGRSDDKAKMRAPAAAPSPAGSAPGRPGVSPALRNVGEEGETVEVSGTVVDPDGKPFSGAQIVCYNPQADEDYPDPAPLAVRSTTGLDGKFRFLIKEPGLMFVQQQATYPHYMVATLVEGYGPAGATFDTADTARGLTLRLVKDDVPIVGRVLDLEGRPVRDVLVSPVCVFAAEDDSLDGWEAAVAKGKDNPEGCMATLRRSINLTSWRQRLEVKTDADGRFRLKGIGRDRVASLRIEGPTIVNSYANEHARTRPGQDYRVPVEGSGPDGATHLFHGPTSDYVAAPTRPIVGVVRDKDTGAALAGVLVRSDAFAGSEVHGIGHVRTRSDAEGRFRLVGMPGGSGNAIVAEPGPGQPYFGAGVAVPGGNGPAPAVVDISLSRGVLLVRGRLSDKSSGSPVNAKVEYGAFSDNPNVAGIRNLHTKAVTTRDDGSFEVVGLPGRGLLAVRALKDRYLKSQGFDAIPGAKADELFPFDKERFHAFAEINAADATSAVKCDISLDPGRELRGKVLGPDNQPFTGARVVGLNPSTMSPSDVRLTTAEFKAIALDPKHPRTVVFRDTDKKLGASLVLRGDESTPPAVRLEPVATISGRLIDADGNPRSGVRVVCSAFYLSPTLDAQGRFRVENVVPGVTLNMYVMKENRIVEKIVESLMLRPGESRDLGDIASE
jgi:RNA polymerase sigma factor (sigma-70 family)